VDAPTLASLGAQDLSTEQLAALASYLRTLATWLDELRFLELERQHAAHEKLLSRPALGYYRGLLRGDPKPDSATVNLSAH
jgi:hypothetical protein